MHRLCVHSPRNRHEGAGPQYIQALGRRDPSATPTGQRLVLYYFVNHVEGDSRESDRYPNHWRKRRPALRMPIW